MLNGLRRLREHLPCRSGHEMGAWVMAMTQRTVTDPHGDAAFLPRPQSIIALAGAGPQRFAVLRANGALEVFGIETAYGLRHLPWRPRVSDSLDRRVGSHPDATALASAQVSDDGLLATVDRSGRLDVTVVDRSSTTSVQLALPSAERSRMRLAMAPTSGGAYVAAVAGRHLVPVAVRLLDTAQAPTARAGEAYQHPGRLSAVEVVDVDGAPLLVVGDERGQLTVLDSTAKTRQWESSRALAAVRGLRGWKASEGETLFAAVHADGVATIWQITNDGGGLEVAARATIPAQPAGPRALAVGPQPWSTPLLAVAGASELRVWNLGGDDHLTVEMEAVVAVELLKPPTGDAVAVMATRGGDLVVRGLDGTAGWFPTAEGPISSTPRPADARPQVIVRASSDRPYIGEGEDHLEFGRYADALALLLENDHTGTPLTVAIDGPWGSGKTSLGRMVQRRLAREQPLATARRSPGIAPPPVTCWFDAWTHDGGDRLSAALAGRMVNTLNPHRPWWQRLLRPIDGRLLDPASRRRRRLRLLLLWPLATAAAVALLLAAAPDGAVLLGQALELELEGPTVVAIGGASISLALLRALPIALARAGATVAQYVRTPVAIADNGSVSRVREELGEFIASATAARPGPAPPSAGGLRRWWERRLDAISRRRVLAVTLGRLLALRPERRFVLFVDNLDRCRPGRAVEACETLSQVLDHDRVATVLMVDMHTLAVAAEVTFQDVAERVFREANGEGWGRAFLEKLVQFDLTLPAPAPEHVRAVFHANAGGDAGVTSP